MKRLKNKSSAEEEQGTEGGGWEVVYSGFAMILLCFFIMLSSFSSIEQTKVMRFVKSFADSISILPGGIKLENGDSVLPASADIVDRESGLAHLYQKLKTLTENRSRENDISVGFSSEGLVMRLSDHALFDVGVAEVSPKAAALLRKVGAIISDSPYEVRVEGHTDNAPIKTSRYPSNWELSTARAVNVLRYFVDSCGILSTRISAEGFGEYHPIAPNDNAANRAQNRRVEIIFLNTGSKQPVKDAAP
jgi:chemotaxis protein MotB